MRVTGDGVFQAVVALLSMSEVGPNRSPVGGILVVGLQTAIVPLALFHHSVCGEYMYFTAMFRRCYKNHMRSEYVCN